MPWTWWFAAPLLICVVLASTVQSNTFKLSKRELRQLLAVARPASPTTDYSIGKLLGQGSFGTVYEAKNLQTLQPAALKRLDIDGKDNRPADVVKEIYTMQQLSKAAVPNAIKIYDAYFEYESNWVYSSPVLSKGSSARSQDKPTQGALSNGMNEHKGPTVWIAMELVEGVCLQDRIEKNAALEHSFSVAEVSYVIHEVMTALAAMHAIGFVHRDIKGENVMFARPDSLQNIRLADFGLSACRQKMTDIDNQPRVRTTMTDTAKRKSFLSNARMNVNFSTSDNASNTVTHSSGQSHADSQNSNAVYDIDAVRNTAANQSYLEKVQNNSYIKPNVDYRASHNLDATKPQYKTEYSNWRLRTHCGTPPYMAPDIFNNRDGYGAAVDIWSTGILALEMIEGALPYNIDDISSYRVAKDYFRRMTKPPDFKEPHRWPNSMVDFVQQCLTLDPVTRPTAIAMLQHPFLQIWKEPARSDNDHIPIDVMANGLFYMTHVAVLPKPDNSPKLMYNRNNQAVLYMWSKDALIAQSFDRPDITQGFQMVYSM